MKKIIALLLIAITAILSGCVEAASLAVDAAAGAIGYQMGKNSRSDQELMVQRQKITMKFNANPDTDAWHDSRQKLSAALV